MTKKKFKGCQKLLKVSALEHWSIGVLKKRHQSFRQYSNTSILSPSRRLYEPEANPPKLTEFECSHDGSPYFWVIDPKKERLKMFDYGKNTTPCQPVSGLKKGSKIV